MVRELLPMFVEPTLQLEPRQEQSNEGQLLDNIIAYIKSHSLSMQNVVRSKDLVIAELHDRNGVWFTLNNVTATFDNQEQPFHCQLLEEVVGCRTVTELQRRR